MAYHKHICPNCHERAGAEILYGFPDWPKVRALVEEGYLVIGGCEISPDNPDRQCTSCGYQWKIHRRSPGSG